MRLTLRLSLALAGGVACVSILFAFLETRAERRGLERNLMAQAMVLAQSLGPFVGPLVERHAYSDLQALVDAFQGRDQLAGVAVYDAGGRLVAEPASLASRGICVRPRCVLSWIAPARM